METIARVLDGNEGSVVEDKQLTRAIISHCRKLYDNSVSSHIGSNIKEYDAYYRGRFKGVNRTSADLKDVYNAVKPIVDAKSTLVLDSNIEISVEPKIFSFQSLENAKFTRVLSDIMDACLKNVWKVNKKEILERKWAKGAAKTGIAIAEITWDQTMEEGLGDVSIKFIDPNTFFPDPKAKDIKSAKYITIKSSYSKMELKSMYPDFVDEIDRLANVAQNASISTNSAPPPKSGAVTNFRTQQQASQMFVSHKGLVPNSTEQTIDVFKTYLVDDATYFPDSGDTSSQTEAKLELSFSYPNGRVIIWAGENVIFEDKPIDYPFGFPFEIMNWSESDDEIWGQGEIEGLMDIQDRISRAYYRIMQLVADFVSIILVDKTSGVATDSIFLKKSPVLMVDPGVTNPSNGKLPYLLTNNTLSELNSMIEYTQVLKNDAKQIARVNDIILSGERPTGVTSGDMVDALLESPMTSIRDIQRAYKEFLVGISNKVVTLIQLYYNTQRIIRLSEGNRFVQLPTVQDGEPSVIKTYEMSEDGQVLQATEDIQGDLSLIDYEVTLVAGTEIPRSRGALSALTMNLAKENVLGPIGSPDTNEKILSSISYPNWRAIVAQQREEQARMSEATNQLASSFDKLSIKFDELPVFAQAQVLEKMGIKLPPELLPLLEPQEPQAISPGAIPQAAI